ncbi:MAG: dihydroxyacetone kinase subunit DhaK [Eubacteriales bacterium]|nr:dihydroxyacetone kinase subunit DhaK [Eubacteriales bacterium]
MGYLTNPDRLTKDCIDGMALIYPDRVQTLKSSYNGRALLHNPIHANRVNIITSAGGLGGPFAVGFPTGEDFCDVGINGGPCAAPSAYDIYEAAKYINSPHGYILIYNNFMGDGLNNDLALELLELEGYRGRLVPVHDDCLSVDANAPRDERTGLIGGSLLTTKIASAAAKEGQSLDEIASLLSHVGNRMSSLNVTYDFQNQTIMLGEGISGEKARIIHQNCFTLQDSVKLAYNYLYQDLKPCKDENLHLVVSRTFSTLYEDLFSFVKYFHQYASTVHPIKQTSAGHYLRMDISYGFSVTLLCADKSVENYLSKRIYTESFIL